MDSSGQDSNPSAERETAPGTLAIVQDFSNAHFVEEPEEDRDRKPETIAAWLADHDMAAAGGEVRKRDRETLLELRGAIRSMLLANDGAPIDKRAVARLNEIAASATLRVDFAPSGGAQLTTAESGAKGAIAHLVAYIMHAMSDGTWQRLKICRADDCQWAFYDKSKNHSGAWCSMSNCGNRAKARAYRERHRA